MYSSFCSISSSYWHHSPHLCEEERPPLRPRGRLLVSRSLLIKGAPPFFAFAQFHPFRLSFSLLNEKCLLRIGRKEKGQIPLGGGNWYRILFGLGASGPTRLLVEQKQEVPASTTRQMPEHRALSRPFTAVTFCWPTVYACQCSAVVSCEQSPNERISPYDEKAKRGRLPRSFLCIFGGTGAVAGLAPHVLTTNHVSRCPWPPEGPENKGLCDATRRTFADKAKLAVHHTYLTWRRLSGSPVVCEPGTCKCHSGPAPNH